MTHARLFARARLVAILTLSFAAVATVTAPPSMAVGGHTLDVVPPGAAPGSDAGSSAANLPVSLAATIDGGTPLVGVPVEIDFEILGGPNDVTSPTNAAGNTPSQPDFTCSITTGLSSCNGTYTPTIGNVDTICAWAHDPAVTDRSTEADCAEGVNETLQPGNTMESDNTDVVSMLITGGTGGGTGELLDCIDENISDAGGPDKAVDPTTGSQADTNETYTCKVTLSGAGVPNVALDGKVIAGPNQTGTPNAAVVDFSCTTTAAGTCTMDVPGSALPPPLAAGLATVCFWIDTDGDTEYNQANTGDGAGCNEAYNAPENDNAVDVTQIDWQTRAVATIDIDTTSEDDFRILPAQNTYTVNVKAIDQFGTGIVDVNIDLYIVGGPNHDNGTVVTHTCKSTSDGTCGITYPSGGFNGIDKFCAWRDLSPPDQLYDSSPSGLEIHGGKCATEPDSPGQINDGGTPLTDRGQVTWSGGTDVASQLQVTPEVAPNGSVAKGTEYALAATVKDQNGNASNNVKVDFELVGPGDPDGADSPSSPDRSCTTDTSGQCSLSGSPGAIGSGTTFTSNVDGTTTVRSWVDGTPADTAEGADAGPSPDEPSTTPDTPGNNVEPDTTDVVLVRWGQLTTSITNFVVSPTSHIATWGVKPVLTGLLTDADAAPLGNVTVSVKRRFGGGAFSFIGSTQTGNDGTFSFQDTSVPGANCGYQVVYGGDASHLGSTSSIITFYIRVGVIFNVNPLTLPRGHSATLSGLIAPNHPGKRVTLQFLNGAAGRWDNVRTVTLDRNSRYQFQYTRNGPGYLLFRIIYATQDTDHVWNVSRNLKITWT